jgi:type IV pilus assembly protein PilY1
VLTDPSAVGDIVPTLMWRISGDSAEYPNLSETWSRPAVTRMRFGAGTEGVSELVDVVAFGGGYDATQDGGFFGPSQPGNAIYIADAETGDRLFSISSDDPGLTNHLVVDDMNCPIPSDLFFFDSDGDGGSDRIYVGDLCGQVWRVDFTPDLTDAGGINVVVGKFAELSDAVELEDHRKIFTRPEVAQVLNTEFTTTARYDLVTVVTGNRDNPLNLDVVDRMYALRDFHVEPLTDADGDGIADVGVDDDGDGVVDTGYATIQGPITGDPGTLFDATSIVDNPEDVQLEQLQTADGWFITFTDSGEKSLAAPVILAGKLFVTTYLPEGVVDASTCALAEGSGRLYGVNVLTGAVVFNWDEADGTDTLTVSDKSYALGTGIPSSAVPIFQEEGITLLIGGGGGATTVDPDIELPRGRTFWYQQE